MVLPECLPRRQEAVLLRDDNLGYCLPGILLRIPGYSDVLDGLLFDILQELELQQVFRVMISVEFLQPVAQDVVGVGVWLDRLFVQLPLRVRRRDQAEFGYIVTKAVSCLRILPRGLCML